MMRRVSLLESGGQGMLGGLIAGAVLGALYGCLLLAWTRFQVIGSIDASILVGIIGIVPGGIIGTVVGSAVGVIDGMFLDILVRAFSNDSINIGLKRQLVGVPCTILAILGCRICFSILTPQLKILYNTNTNNMEIVAFLYTTMPAIIAGLGAAYTSKTLLRWYEHESQKGTAKNVTPN
jgi:hypothetical protein